MSNTLLSAVLALALPAFGASAQTVAKAPTPPRSVVTPAFAQTIPNIPGKSLKVVTVDYAPGASGGSHRHASSAFIFAYVLEGEIRSQVDGAPVRVYHVGESWQENPGAHHQVSENASATKPAKLLAVFVVDTDETALTIRDQ